MRLTLQKTGTRIIARFRKTLIGLITSFIQKSADKHIASKTRRWVSSVPCVTPEIRRKIRRRNKTHAKAKKTDSSKLRSKFETLRREIKADVKKQHDLYVNNLVGDIMANPRDFYRYINGQNKDTQGIPPLKRRNAESELEQADEFNGQFTDVAQPRPAPQSVGSFHELYCFGCRGNQTSQRLEYI